VIRIIDGIRYVIVPVEDLFDKNRWESNEFAKSKGFGQGWYEVKRKKVSNFYAGIKGGAPWIGRAMVSEWAVWPTCQTNLPIRQGD
jgi:hypothetical protein